MRYLRVDSSVRRDGSVSRELTGAVVRAWLAADPDAEVVYRDLAAEPGLVETWQLATEALFAPPAVGTAQFSAARAGAAAADQLLAADAVVVGAPMYNFGPPAAVKAWLDLLITDARLDPRRAPEGGALRGRPVVLAVACGGGYGPDSPRTGWDHATPYLRRIFADVFGADVTTIVAEYTVTDDHTSRRAALAAAERIALPTPARDPVECHLRVV
jgi:FMN-dependent NADH-azoreductase